MREKVLRLFEIADNSPDSESEEEVSEEEDLQNSLDLLSSLELDVEEESDGESDAKERTTISNKQRKVLPQLLQNCSVILRIINSDEQVNVEEFELLCRETNLILIDHFSFMNITPTVHAVLAHSPDIIRNNKGVGLNCHSEEGSEGSHKVLRHVREHGARKMSLELNLKDAFRKMWFMSDPTIRNMKRKLICSHCEDVGHTVRSCPEVKEVGKNEDDLLIESLIYKDLTSYDCLDNPENMEELHMLDVIDEVMEEQGDEKVQTEAAEVDWMDY